MPLLCKTVLFHRRSRLHAAPPFHCIALRLCALPLLSVSPLFRCAASHFTALPSQCGSPRCFTVAVPSIASHSLAVAALCVTGPCRCIAERFAALPWRFIALQCYSVALRLPTLPSVSFPFRGKSSTGYALPLLFPSEHFLRFSLHFSSVASHLVTAPGHADAPRSLALPLRHIAPRCHSAALLDFLPDEPALAAVAPLADAG